VPVPERAPLRAVDDASLVTDWLEVERLADHARRTGLDVVVLRPAALVGLGPAEDGALLRQLASSRLLAFRGVEPLWQLCHADDLVTALEVAGRNRLSGDTCAVHARLAAAVRGSRSWPAEPASGRRPWRLSTAECLHRPASSPARRVSWSPARRRRGSDGGRPAGGRRVPGLDHRGGAGRAPRGRAPSTAARPGRGLRAWGGRRHRALGRHGGMCSPRAPSPSAVDGGHARSFGR
jgi:hypothetical protein